jgi:hypothetical protein
MRTDHDEFMGEEESRGSVKTETDANYLKNLLGKHTGSMDKVANFT